MSNDMSDTKRHKSIYAFLESSGVLESNDPELIKNARQAYWRTYHREYKKGKREKAREHTVTLEKREEQVLKEEAAKNEMTLSKFIKEMALAYVNKEYIRPPNEELSKIEVSLSHIRTLLEGYGRDEKIATQAINAISAIERSLDQMISAPLSLESEVRRILSERPSYLSTMKQIISEYDY